jgi:hypothetical protein
VQEARQGLARLVKEAEQREEAEAVLIGAGGAPLLGVDTGEGGIDVEDQLLGPGTRIPGPLAGRPSRLRASRRDPPGRPTRSGGRRRRGRRGPRRPP